MKDASSRFNLESIRVKITARAESSLTIVVIGMAGLFIIFSIINDEFIFLNLFSSNNDKNVRPLPTKRNVQQTLR